jgi:hypothetical protein
MLGPGSCRSADSQSTPHASMDLLAWRAHSQCRDASECVTLFAEHAPMPMDAGYSVLHIRDKQTQRVQIEMKRAWSNCDVANHK